MAEVKKTAAKKMATKKPAKAAVKPAEKEAAAKSAAKKPEAVKKTAAKKAPAKTTSLVSTTYFEVDGDQIRIDDVYTKVVDAYKAAGHRMGSVKTLDLYYNFSERRCYYVVNGKADGLFVEF